MKSYKSYLFNKKWAAFKYRKTHAKEASRDLFLSWKSKIEHQKFKSYLRVVGRMQMNYRHTMLSRNLRLHKYISQVIGRSYKFYKIRQVFILANKQSQCLKNCRDKILYRRFFMRVKLAREHMDWIYDLFWKQIEVNFKEESAVALQRTLRGHLDRLASASDLKQLEEIKRNLKQQRIAILIQKWVRGFLVRARLDR